MLDRRQDRVSTAALQHSSSVQRLVQGEDGPGPGQHSRQWICSGNSLQQTWWQKQKLVRRILVIFLFLFSKFLNLLLNLLSFRKEYKVFKFLVRCLIYSCEVFDHQNRIKDFEPADLESTQDIRVMVYLASNTTESSILQSFILLHFIRDS